MRRKDVRKGSFKFSYNGNDFTVEVRKSARKENSIGLESWYTQKILTTLARGILKLDNFELNSLIIKSPKE